MTPRKILKKIIKPEVEKDDKLRNYELILIIKPEIAEEKFD